MINAFGCSFPCSLEQSAVSFLLTVFIFSYMSHFHTASAVVPSN